MAAASYSTSRVIGRAWMAAASPPFAARGTQQNSRASAGRMLAAQHQGPAKGLEAVGAIEDASRLAAYPFYPAVLGELELRCGRTEAAPGHFEDARRLARNDGERRFLDHRIEECAGKALS